jgi:Fe-S cluster assembly scaffold protein SufB
MSSSRPSAGMKSILQQRDPAWTREFEAMLEAYEIAGGEIPALESDHIASAVISANKVLAVNEIPGIRIEADEKPNGVRARITVAPGTRVKFPVHLCFGMIPEEGLQEIISEFEIGAEADVSFLAHCTFPNAVDLRHVMDANLRIGPAATMRYTEAHYHGTTGGIVVQPTSHITVGEAGRLENEFNLTHGRVGRMEIDVEVDVAAQAAAELIAKAYGFSNDSVRVDEVMRLNGPNARGVTRTRVAVRDAAISEIFTTAEGNAPGARGHMDCTEIVRGSAVASNLPRVVVRDESARVTHEAAIGSVSRKELETLMARGVSEDDAVDIVIRGMLG